MSRLGAQIATAVEPGRNGFARSASEIDLVIQVAEARHTNRGLVPHGPKLVASEPERSVCGFALQSDDEIAMTASTSLSVVTTGHAPTEGIGSKETSECSDRPSFALLSGLRKEEG